MRFARAVRPMLFTAALLGALPAPAATPTGIFTGGPKLVGSNVIGIAQQGASVALSADGNTALVGGSWDDSNAGAAWVFTRANGVWTEQKKLVGTGASGAAWQGTSVALSADGSTALVGGALDAGSTGAAWVFTRSGSVWTQQGAKLVGSGASGNATQGYSVALSADGATALIGGYADAGGTGATWVFTRSGSSWVQQGSKLVGTGASGAAYQGVAVRLSADGGTALVGGYGDDALAGAAWVFTRSGSSWTQQGQTLVGSGATGKAWQGYAVALSGDGDTAMLGGYADASYAGASWIFTRSGGTWTQQGSKLVGSGALFTGHQGTSVSLSGDGDTAIVGAPVESGGGAAWVFARSGGVWIQRGAKIVGTGAVLSAQQGQSVALSGDGGTAIVGGFFDDSSVGAAWIHDRIPSKGDVNGDGAITVGDVFYLVNVLFSGGPVPR